MNHFLLVGLGGGFGSVLRYMISIFLPSAKNNFPIATFIVNLIGCFLIGLLIAFLKKNNFENKALESFLVIGFCGGFTTFSAFSKEAVLLFQQQQYGIFILYVLGSFIVCFLATMIGFMVFKN